MNLDAPGIRLLSFGSRDVSLSPTKSSSSSKNNKLEQMRSKIKNSMFEQKSVSLNIITSKTNLEDETSRSPSKQNSAMRKKGFLSPNNPNLEKYRNLVRRSLAIPGNSTSNLFDLQPSPADDMSETGFSSMSKNSFFEDINPRNHDDDSSCKSRSEKAFEGEEVKDLSYYGVEECTLEEELEEQALPERKLKKKSVFINNLEGDIEELKKELKVDEDPDIHFIKGNFHMYYDEKEILGEGTTATVKKCYRKTTREKFAVKILHYRDDTEMLVLIVKEFKNYKRLEHKHVIKVYELYIDYWLKKIYTIMELAECQEMFEVLQDLGHYSEAVASEIFKQILSGINYLHINGVCHRDLKPNNILVSQDGEIVKITDFNVSKFTEDKSKKYSSLSTDNCKMWTHTGTIAFTAPEVFTDNEYTESVDMWSAGVVLYTMLCGYQPFYAEYVHDLIAIITQGKVEFNPDPWDNISDDAKDLISKCLDLNHKTRYLPSDALMHPWIANHGGVSNHCISQAQDNLKSYIIKGKKKLRRRVTTRAEDLNLKISPVIRGREKRSGTVTNQPENEPSNTTEEAKDTTNPKEKKHSRLTKLIKGMPSTVPKGNGLGHFSRSNMKNNKAQGSFVKINESYNEERSNDRDDSSRTENEKEDSALLKFINSKGQQNLSLNDSSEKNKSVKSEKDVKIASKDIISPTLKRSQQPNNENSEDDESGFGSEGESKINSTDVEFDKECLSRSVSMVCDIRPIF